MSVSVPVDVMMDGEFAQWLRETRPASWKNIGFLKLRYLVQSYEAFIIAGNEARKGGAGWFPLSLDEFMQVWIQKEPILEHDKTMNDPDATLLSNKDSDTRDAKGKYRRYEP